MRDSVADIWVVAGPPGAGKSTVAALLPPAVKELGGPRVHLVWVHTDPRTLRGRIEARGLERDGAKLGDYAAYVARIRPDLPPAVPHARIDNRGRPESLVDQVDRLVGENGIAGA